MTHLDSMHVPGGGAVAAVPAVPPAAAAIGAADPARFINRELFSMVLSTNMVNVAVVSCRNFSRVTC